MTESTGLSASDRAAALNAPPVRVPRKAIYFALGAVVVLGAGGVLLEHVFSATGLNAYSVTASSASKPKAAPLRASERSLLGLTTQHGNAPPLALVDQSGTPVTLASLRGKVVVLTFLDASCDDICPVYAKELLVAEHDLGSSASGVAFVAVNSDPRSLATAQLARTTASVGLAHESNWYFLSGSLGALDVAWTRYKVTILVNTKTQRESHTDVIYFLDPSGAFRYRATPFANQSKSGSYSLPTSTVNQFGQGIATFARTLLH